MNYKNLETNFNSTLKETNQNSKSSLVTNDSSIIINILSGLCREEIKPAKNSNSQISKTPISAGNEKAKELKKLKNLNSEKIFDYEKFQQRQEKLLAKFNSQTSLEKLKNSSSEKTIEENSYLAAKTKVFIIKKTKKSFKLKEQKNTLHKKLKKQHPFSQTQKAKNQKQGIIQELTVKYNSVLNYSFMASFSRKNLINISNIELERFMNPHLKTLFLQNLNSLNERQMLGRYLKFNTITAFDEIGEIGSNIKKLSAFLSCEKIGFQFLIIKNDYFTNKILILFPKDCFPFKSYLQDEKEFFVLKVDKDFLSTNYFSESEYKKNQKATDENYSEIPCFSANNNNKNNNKNPNESESKLFNFRTDSAKGYKTTQRKIKQLRKNKNAFSYIIENFRRRKIRKMQAQKNKRVENNFTTEHAQSNSSHFSEKFALENNLINFENNNNNNYFANCFEKLLLLNCILLNNSNASSTVSSKNENANSNENSMNNISLANQANNKSEVYSGIFEICKAADFSSTQCFEDKNTVSPFVDTDNSAKTKITISLESFQVIQNVQDAYAGNQSISRENNKVKCRFIRMEVDEEDGNYNINSI